MCVVLVAAVGQAISQCGGRCGRWKPSSWGEEAGGSFHSHVHGSRYGHQTRERRGLGAFRHEHTIRYSESIILLWLCVDCYTVLLRFGRPERGLESNGTGHYFRCHRQGPQGLSVVCVYVCVSVCVCVCARVCVYVCVFVFVCKDRELLLYGCGI